MLAALQRPWAREGQRSTMIDVEKQVAYWRDGAKEDWEVAQELVDRGRTRHGLFFGHLALEKLLKAHVCRAIQDLAPRTHALLRLAESAGLALSATHREFVARFDRYQLEGRYPSTLPAPPTLEVAKREMQAAREVVEWLTERL